jgi:hypothetical protein
MTFHWSPLPHVGLEDGAVTEAVLNVTLYGMGLGIAGALVWLAALAVLDRAK